MEESLTSPAAQVIIAVIPIVGIVIGGTVVFFYLLWRHREISLQIRTGTFHPKKFDYKLFSLFTGLLLLGVGSVLTVLFALLEGVSYTLLGGLIPFIIGIGLMVFYKVCPEPVRKDGES
ncbi:hypothetical protein [Treponema brennaborense]|uniref:Uncharacterized protein n=1 Tax=Treponema brennaborense (strain DSM 12168 / CIP 105900 / DD5/3) TaxID=906968 RepID=F4LPF4_TREBD|nr:hypothetical protein [Treponema brennaborense]AEE15965.1 hypothetical protein Trebr_0522 [Treponema brennaborense DSM 12168]